MPGEEAAVNVQVAVRCRPVNEEEKKSGQAQVISCNPGKRTCDVSYGVGSKKQTKTYSFDKVFGAYSTQEEVFDTMVSPIVQECLAGFNSSQTFDQSNKALSNISAAIPPHNFRD